MRFVVIALFMSTLCACSTVSDTRNTPPVLSLVSSAPPLQVAECIQDGWQNTSLVGGSVGGALQKSGSTYSVIAPNTETPWHVVDVAKSHSGSKVSYHFFRSWQSPSDKVLDVVRRCSK